MKSLLAPAFRGLRLFALSVGTFLTALWVVVAVLTIPLGVGLFAAGLRYGDQILDWHTQWTRFMLAPPAQDDLQRRVRQLTESRSEAVDASAAELRRIERDLHDGAQARLVAMGMTLGA